MQQRLIIPVIVHCQIFPDPVPNEEEKLPKEHPSSHFLTDYSAHHRVPSAHTSSSTISPGPLVLETSVTETTFESVASIPLPSKLKESIYIPFHMRLPETPSEPVYSSSGFSGEFLKPVTSESLSSVPTEMQWIESKNGKSKEIFEKCIPLMNDHYCIDEICYKLHISHALIWRLIRDNHTRCYVYYVIPNLLSVSLNNQRDVVNIATQTSNRTY